MKYIIASFITLFVILVACRKNYFSTYKLQESIDISGYPEKINKLIITKCATEGCHDNVSYTGAAGLNLTNWNTMLAGGKGGAVVVPYNHIFSTLFIYCNTFDDLGQKHIPRMPIDADALTREEMILLKDWINSGAKNDKGQEAWPESNTRKKIYIVNQGCDVVSVFDLEKQILIKQVFVGSDQNLIESPHQIKVSPDNKYWYILFLRSKYFEKYDAVTDKLISKVFIGNTGNWNTMALSKDGKFLFLTDLSGGIVLVVDANKMTIKKRLGTDNFPLFNAPHAITISPDGDTCTVVSQNSANYYQFSVSDVTSNSPFINYFNTGNVLKNLPSSAGPHDMLYSPDGTKLFITCQGIDNIAVYKAQTLEFIKLISVKKYPQELAVSVNKNYLLVTCSETFIPNSKAKGSIEIIDMNTLNMLASIPSNGVQPHGIAVDENTNTAYIANRNVDQNGLAPHHVSYCSGRNGNLSILDLNTLTFSTKKSELSVDPYFISIKY